MLKARFYFARKSTKMPLLYIQYNDLTIEEMIILDAGEEIER
jgi:hypothetical protein